jgi:hypothetical protein
VLRRSLLVAVTALATAAPSAAGADGTPPPARLNANLAAPGGRLVLSARTHDTRTTVRMLQHGRVLASRTLTGRWGVPLVTWTQRGGFSADGRRVVLSWVGQQYPAPVSRFAVLDPTLRSLQRVTLRGDYGFDALSPDGRLLYLIQRLDTSTSAWAYRVRVFDLATGHLRPHPIADRVEHEWTMQGIPLDRLTGRGGGVVYTLYQTPRGGTFVHALDTRRASARCIDLRVRIGVGRLHLAFGGAGLRVLRGARVLASFTARIP